MIRSIAVFAALAGAVLTESTANAAFSISVTSAAPGFTNFSSSTTLGTAGGTGTGQFFNNDDLFMSYNITNNPGSGFYTLNNIQFFYANNPAALNLTLTITETAATLFPTGTNLNGFASFNANGNVNSTFNATTTISGTGANSMTFPNTNFNVASTPYSASTSFTSAGTPGSISTVWNISIFNNSNVRFSAGGGFGSIGADLSAVPVPATALLGVLGVPVLAVIRRRRNRQ